MIVLQSKILLLLLAFDDCMPQYTLYADTAREADEWITVLQQATCVLYCLCVYMCVCIHKLLHKGVAYCAQFSLLHKAQSDDMPVILCAR